MKKMFLGAVAFLSGFILQCTLWAVDRIIDAMPDVSVVGSGFPVHPLAAVLMLAGAAVLVWGYRE